MLSEVLRAGHEPTAGLSHLSTPDSILMSYQKSKHGVVEALGAFTQIGAIWVRLRLHVTDRMRSAMVAAECVLMRGSPHPLPGRAC
jgi:hypothetical protein